jgi:hypothetical protein
MPGPPPKPKAPDDLAEVERALSVLQGRHPEHERARREQEETRAKRQAELDATAKIELVKTRKRQAKIGAIAGAALVVLTVVFILVRREVVRHGKLDRSTEPYRAQGFVVTDTTTRGAPGKLDATPEAGCYVAVSTDAAPLEVTRGPATAKGPAPVLFCTCDAALPVTVTSQVAEGGGLSLMKIDAAVIGGSKAFAFSPVKGATLLKTDDACADATLDAWIDAKHAPPAAPDAKWLTDPKRAPLVAAGGKVIATLAADKPFAVMDVPKESCLLVVSDVATDHVSLRAKGGTTPFPAVEGSFAWCAQADGAYMLQRDGTGTVDAVALPAVKMGGVRGLRTVLADAEIAPKMVAVAPNDLAWDAMQYLLASAVPEALITTGSTPDVSPEPEARLVAMTFATPNALVPELQTDTYSYCEPTLDEKMREGMCFFSGSQTWRAGGREASGGLARAKLPFWLFGLKGVNDPVALKAGLRLVDIARSLKAQGFEATAMEAVTEVPGGVEVLGRAHEDAIVAVGAAPMPPWVFTYTDGPDWTLDDAPRIIPIKTLQTLKLTASGHRLLPAKDKRRSVIFRHAVKEE